MKAIAIVPGAGTIQLADRAEPSVAARDEIKLRVLQVGICGTDREEASGGRAQAPEGEMDLIFEATGVPSLEFNLLDALSINGGYVLTGVPGGDRPLQIPGAEIIRNLVLKNQVMMGSVNAARCHFRMAVDDLLHKHRADEIKVVLQWAA